MAPGSLVEVRPFGQKDLDVICAIEARSFDKPYPRWLLKQLAARNPSTFLVATLHGVPVGYAVAEIDGDDAHVISIAVDPDQRGKGIGRALMERLLGILQAMGVSNAHLEVWVGNQGAIRLYEGLGFQRTGTISNYYGKGKHAYVYRVQLEGIKAGVYGRDVAKLSSTS